MKEAQKRGRRTHAPGQILVSTNSAMLLRFTRGSDGPRVFVKPNPTSNAMYVVAAKNAAVKNVNGCRTSGRAKFPGQRASVAGSVWQQGAEGDSR